MARQSEQREMRRLAEEVSSDDGENSPCSGVDEEPTTRDENISMKDGRKRSIGLPYGALGFDKNESNDSIVERKRRYW